MSTKYVNVDRQTPMLLPPDVREWVADNELAHFVLEAVEATNLAGARVNVRGTGDAQYPPGLMLALLIYNYATGTFSSRAMERAGYDSMAVRYLCANHHPDHDTIAKFRRENGLLVRAAFVRVLEMAREVGLLKLGTVSVDGTKIAAAAAKRRSLRRGQLEAEMARLQGEVDELLAERESAGRDEPTVNPSDPDSTITPTAQGPFIQGYTAQAAVSAEGPTSCPIRTTASNCKPPSPPSPPKWAGPSACWPTPATIIPTRSKRCARAASPSTAHRKI